MSAILYEGLVTLIYGGILAVFCILPLKKHLRISTDRVMLGSAVFVCMLAVLDTLVSNTIGNMIPFDYTFFTSFLWLYLGYLALSYATDQPWYRLLFLMLLSLNIINLSRSITLLIYGLFAEELLAATYSFIDLFGFGIPAIVIALPGVRLVRHYFDMLDALDAQAYSRLWMIPLFFHILYVVQILLYPADEYILANTVKICIMLCAFVTYSQMVNAIVKSAKASKEEMFHKQLQHQLAIETARIADMKQHMSEIKRIRHDHRQHLHILQGLLQEHKAEEALQYLEEYENSIADVMKPPLCENFVADTICRRYQTLAVQCGIRVSVHACLAQDAGIAGNDLAVILGNMWENAIAAVLDGTNEQKFIRLWIQSQKDRVMIRMENGYSSILIDDNSQFLSTKQDQYKKEGIGISSIKAVAEQYEGTAEFSYTAEVFTVSVLLYIPDNPIK